MAGPSSLHLPHIAILPSAGMGHLTPFLRFAASLVKKQQCQVTLITIQPTVSISESELIARFLSAYPQVTAKEFHLLPFDPATANSTDPFFLRWEASRRSVAKLLPSIVSSLSPPISALVYDISLVTSVVPIATELSLSTYVFFTASARMFSFLSSFHSITAPKIKSGSAKLTDLIDIPGLPPIPMSSIPPLLLNPETLFHNIFASDSPNVVKVTGLLINTFEKLEPLSLAALNSGRVVAELPQVHAVGPLLPFEFEKTEKDDAPLKWLDDQPAGSVVYVSFGSRTSMSREQIRELGYGIMKSGYRYLWVVKTKKVDKDEDEDLDVVLGHELWQRMKGKGLVVNNWVDQNKILDHKAVGGFLTHCGWNSAVEAAVYGVRMLAWPLHGDQRINAEVMESVGMGFWVRSWDWVNQEDVVKGAEIGEKIKELMQSESLREKAAKVKEDARNAVADSGSFDRNLNKLIEEWKNATTERYK